MSLGIYVGTASGEPLPRTEDGARYLPVQSISYDFGSKSVRGYFVTQAAMCLVTLMILERSDPEEPMTLSPTRVRLSLHSGQVAGLDAEEGRSLNLACGEDAATLLVQPGERQTLVALQALSLREALAAAPLESR